jgi:ABC-type molybdate transport system substrate-binding protein
VDIQTYIVLTTGLSAAAAEPEAGKALIKFLTSDAATPVIKAKGWDPASH